MAKNRFWLGSEDKKKFLIFNSPMPPRRASRRERTMDRILEDQIYQDYQSGIPLIKLCQKFNLTLGEVARIIRKREWTDRGIKESIEVNCIIEIAKKNKRNYITPEDVIDALKDNDTTKVRYDLLEVLGKQTGFGVEDYGLCAFNAWAYGLPRKGV